MRCPPEIRFTGDVEAYLAPRSFGDICGRSDDDRKAQESHDDVRRLDHRIELLDSRNSGLAGGLGSEATVNVSAPAAPLYTAD